MNLHAQTVQEGGQEPVLLYLFFGEQVICIYVCLHMHIHKVSACKK